MTGIPVSVIVMTRNEAANLPDCLAGLRRFSEVFVVDSQSEDATQAIAVASGATVVSFVWNGRYPKKKQWCLSALPFKHDWVLFVDADERVTPELAEEIETLLAHPTACRGYFIDGDYVFMNRRLRHGFRNRKLALVDRTVTRFAEPDDLHLTVMGEVEGHYQPIVDGRIGRLRRRMLHADAKPLFFWFERHNRYSDWEADLRAGGYLKKLADRELPGRRFAKHIFDRLPFRPVAVFLHSYVLRLGFLDGAPGFHLAVARSFYYWQVAIKMRDGRNIRNI